MAQDDYWTQNLLPAKLDGVEFDIAERNVDTGRDFARYRYPYRNAQGVEDLGRKAMVWTLQVPLFRGVGTNHYPGTFDKLMAIVDDDAKKAEVEYQDPEWGPFNVKIADAKWVTVGTQRDGGILTLVLEEVGFEQSVTANLNKPQFAARAKARAMASKLDYALDVQGYSLPDVSKKGWPSLTEMWRAVQSALDAGAMAADQVAARIDEVMYVANDVLNFSAKDEIERWSITNSIVDFMGAVQDAGNDSGDVPPEEKLIKVTLPDTMSMFDIALWRYKDPVRADEIAYLNPYQNPSAYPRGMVIKVFAK